MGIVAAGVAWGAWPVVLAAGVVSLMIRRSYGVLVLGVVLDLTLMLSGEAFMDTYFYTIVFFGTTIVAEYVRRRIFWR